MSIAAATVRMRPARGPALGKAPVPFTAAVVSAIAHVVLAVVVVVGARFWTQSQPKTYIVNLLPAVAAVGARPEPPRPRELPQRETPRETAPPEMPAREMPPRPRESLTLPDRATPPRAAATPRAGDKELPSMTTPTPKTPERAPTETIARATP